MRVRDLGALVVDAGTQDKRVVGTRAAAILALLTINVNQRVSTDALAEAAWGEDVTSGSASTLLSHIWRLRQLLEPVRDRQTASVLVNDSGGYRLVGGPSTVDSLQFAEAAKEVRDLLAAGHADSAVRRADAALGLWRGTPYGALAETDWARAAVARLEELRSQLQESRLEGLLASDELDTVVSDLQPLIAALPYREPLRALQMEALYRAGRSEEALQAYSDARRTLLDEVGIEPGPELRQLHQRILQNDPSFARRVERPKPPPPREVEVHLPPALTALIGRDQVQSRLAQLVRDQRLVTITGAAGSGKTRLAVEVARSVAPDFPDGVWFVDLTAVSDPDLVIDVVVSTIGFAASAGASPLQDLRRYLQTRRMLLVLDNCEHVLGSVEEIVQVTLGDPGVTPECCFLTTSREPIGIDGETVWTLNTLDLPTNGADPTSSPAVQLFLQRLAAVAPTVEIDDQVLTRAVDICVAVDGLPLPIELAASRAHSHSLDDIAAQVIDDPGRLSRVGHLGRRGRDHRATVRSAIEWSHRLLSPEEQRAHRRLSVLPGAFTARPAVAVLADPADTDAILDEDELLTQLVHRSLVASDGASGAGRSSAFRQLATVRSHARHALADAGETAACLDRRDAWTGALVATRPPLGTNAEAAWYRALDDDYATVRATLTRKLIEQPSAEGGRLAYRIAYYGYYRERLVESSRWLQLGRAVLEGDDPTDALLAQLWLASAQAVQSRSDLALRGFDGIDDLVRRTPPERLVEVGEGLVALSLSFYHAEAAGPLAEVNQLLHWVGDQVSDANLELLVDAVGCCALLVAGQLDPAVDLAMSVQRRAQEVDHPMAGYVSTAPMIMGALYARRPEEGMPWIQHCLAMHLRLGTGAVGMFTETRANFFAQLGDYPQAARTYAAAHTTTRRAGMVWPNREPTHQLLAMTRDHLSRAEYERAWQEGERLTLADLAAAATVASPALLRPMDSPAHW